MIGDRTEVPYAEVFRRDDATFLTRVVLTNYKSIAACDVRLGPLMFLVGPNGSGKSNFLDALRFVAGSLNTSLDHALRDRGGVQEVRRRSAGHPTHFGIRLEFVLDSGHTGFYAFRLGARPHGGYEVQTERCEVRLSGHAAPVAFYEVRSGQMVRSSLTIHPAPVPDRLFLVNVSGLREFRRVYEPLSRMGFYNLNPDRIRDPQPPDPGELLMREGGNLASVLAHLGERSPETKRRVEEYLAVLVPGVSSVDRKVLGPLETLEFKQEVKGARSPWSFLATSMSDGTLRAVGILVALFQGIDAIHGRVPLVGIEEPEAGLHPAAAGVLLDAFREASRQRQILIASHSPELLDEKSIDTASILAVAAEQGVTRIAPIDEAGRSVVRDHLYTAGELLRLNQLAPAPEVVPEGPANHRHLFDVAET